MAVKHFELDGGNLTGDHGKTDKMLNTTVERMTNYCNAR